MVTEERLDAALERTLVSAAPNDLGALCALRTWSFYGGKVRDNYTSPDGKTRVLVTTDRLSAFDRVITTLPFKGQVLNRISAYWFEETKAIAPNHLLRVPHPNVAIAKACTPLPVEMVVRAYLTGVTSTSVYTHYARGVREYAGHHLPDGLAKNAPLPEPIVTPSSKAEKGGHDVTMSRAEVLASTGMSPAHFDRAAALAMDLYRFGAERASERGLVLADTKYEMGIDASGEIVVIDEMHTPDSSRYWFAGTYDDRFDRGEEPESFDKEIVRRHLADIGYRGDGPIPKLAPGIRVEAARRYIEAFERITGTEFTPDERDPIAGIVKSVEDLSS